MSWGSKAVFLIELQSLDERSEMRGFVCGATRCHGLIGVVHECMVCHSVCDFWLR